MLHKLSLRKALKTVMFLLTCLLMTGCYITRSATVSTIPAEKRFMIIHADENLWRARDYSIADGILTAQLGIDTVKIKTTKTVHIYVAPASAVTVEGATLTVPVVNIGKADYQGIDWLEVLGLTAGAAYLLYMIIVSLVSPY